MTTIADVLSDKSVPARTEKPESVTDDKSEIDERESAADEIEETAAPSAAKETQKPAEPAKADDKPADTSLARDDKGRFQKTVPLEALHAERAKRQALEKQVQAAQKPPPSVLEDEDGAFNARLAQATQPLQVKFFKLSVKAARMAPGREDYDEITQAFLDAAEKDPQLEKAWRESDDPGEYAYSVGKQIKELGDVGGDIVAYGAKKLAEGAAQADTLKQKITALEAEITALKASKDKQEKVPQSLNSEQSAAANGAATFAGPRPLKSILS